MKKTILLFILLIYSVFQLKAQVVTGDSVFDYSSKIEIKRKEKLNESPYALFGDNTLVLKTDHEKNLDHTLKIPLIEDSVQIGLFELDFQTGIVYIKNNEGNIESQQQLLPDQLSRFLTIDPHAENYYGWSPYAYCANNPLKYIDPTGMDWIENSETGNVEWRKDANKDNVPKGYNYIGTEYKGISIIKFEKSNYKTDKAHYSSLAIKIGYKDPNTGEETSYNWVQTVERDDKDKFIDPIDGHDNNPFYQDKRENQSSRNVDGYNVVFYDRPDERQSNGYFSAELSLINTSNPIGKTNGIESFSPSSNLNGKNIYSPIVTMTYGFSVKNGNMTISPIKVVSPSTFQKQAIGKIR